MPNQYQLVLRTLCTIHHSGYGYTPNRMRGPCRWAKVGPHPHFHTDWFCAFRHMTEPLQAKVSLSVKSASPFLLRGHGHVGGKGLAEGDSREWQLFAVQLWDWFPHLMGCDLHFQWQLQFGLLDRSFRKPLKTRATEAT